MSDQFRFDPEWRTTLFAMLLVPALAALGFWQLARAEEKTTIAAEFEQMQQMPAAPLQALARDLAAIPIDQLAYRPVTLNGRFREEQYFLLDNKMVQGRYGNEVLMVFELAGSNTLVLVNRGWVVADPARRSLPEVAPVKGEVTIEGQVYVSPGRQFTLANNPLAAGWPKRIQAVRIDKMAEALGEAPESLFPYPVRIANDAPGALYVDWQIVNVSPAKHYGYALQWFSMSIVLAFLYVLRSSNLIEFWRRRRNQQEQ